MTKDSVWLGQLLDRILAEVAFITEQFGPLETLSPEDQALLGHIDAANACLCSARLMTLERMEATEDGT